MATWLYGSARWGLLAAVPGLLTLAEASKDSCKSACGSTYSTIFEVLSKEQCRQGCEYFFDGDDTTVAECKRRCATLSACSVGCDIGYAECREGDWCQGDERAPCPAGQWCRDQGGSAPSYCDEGRYCLAGEAFVSQGNGECDAGRLCLGGAASRDGTGPCTAGNYCKQGAGPRPCGAGHFCKTGSATAEGSGKTDRGRFSKGAAATALGDGECDAGFYCDAGSASSTEAECWEGHYCTAGTKLPKECQSGTFSARKDSEGHSTGTCRACAPGSFTNSTGQAECLRCSPGRWQRFANQTSCKECEAGSWGPGDDVCEECGFDTYLSSESNTKAGDCMPCPPGKTSDKGSYALQQCLDEQMVACEKGGGWYYRTWNGSETSVCSECEPASVFRLPVTFLSPYYRL